MTKFNNVVIHEPELAYHSRSKSGECMSSHLLQLFCKSPYKYFHEVYGPKEDEQENPAFAFGRAAHKLILEGVDEFNKCYTVSDGPVNEKTGLPFGKTTKAYQEWLACQNGEIVTTEDFGIISDMDNSCRANKEINDILWGVGEAECVVRAYVEGVLCQIRIDWLSDDYGIVDLKTCRDIEFFEKDCRDFGYAYQLAFYRMVFREASGAELPCHVVAVDKTKYNIAGLWRFAPVDLDECEQVLRAALKRYKDAKASSQWATGYERTRVFSLHKEC